MARRTKAELLAELRRVAAIWDVWREFKIMHGPSWYKDTLPTGASSLAAVEAGHVRASEQLAGFMQAINDASEMIGHALQDGTPGGREFLAYYRERTGRDWWDDAGDPTKMVRKVLDRGRIRSETEWYLLENILADVDQEVFTPEEMDRLNGMRRRFEERVAKRRRA